MAVTGDETETGSTRDSFGMKLPSSTSGLRLDGTGDGAHTSPKPVEEAVQRRALRLQKNREAARVCRQKKKEYLKCLEHRVAMLENQNKTLIEELRALKDITDSK
ncbi:unnamed protein product [Ophioblennius macclurei]